MKRRRWPEPSPRFLEAATTLQPRFSEVDVLGIVWHGHYLAYFEDAREAFGRRFDFSYKTIREAGYIAPIVRVEVDYFAPARIEEDIHARVRLHPQAGAWLHYSYLLTRPGGTRLASGRTVQAFTDRDGELMLTRPAFFDEFLARNEEHFRTCDAST